MKSVLVALFTLGLMSLSLPVVSASYAQTAKTKDSVTYDLGQKWRLYIHGQPPSICAMMKIYGEQSLWGVTLLRNSYQQWVLQITNMTWRIPGPSPIQFEFQFGDEPSWDQMGQSVNPLTIQTKVGKEFIYRWKAHKTLKIKMNGSEMTFDLTGTSNGTQVLEQCASALPKLSKPSPGMDS